MTTPDKRGVHDQFNFPAPSLPTPRPQTNQGTIVIPQAPPEPVAAASSPVTLQPPLAPAPPLTMVAPNDDEARRFAELERQRQEEERRKWGKVCVPQVIADNASATGTPRILNDTNCCRRA